MRLTFENVGLLVSILLAEAWFLSGLFAGKPEYEPAITFLGLFIALLSKDKLKERFGAHAASSETSHDAQLFAEFQTVFPFEPTVRLLREHDFGAPFPRSALQPLNDFVATWDSVEKEFKNEKIEKKRQALYVLAQDLASEFSAKTVPIGGGKYLSVLSDSMRGGPRPEWVREEARILNTKSQAFVPTYEEFIRCCRNLFKP